MEMLRHMQTIGGKYIQTVTSMYCNWVIINVWSISICLNFSKVYFYLRIFTSSNKVFHREIWSLSNILYLTDYILFLLFNRISIKKFCRVKILKIKYLNQLYLWNVFKSIKTFWATTLVTCLRKKSISITM